MIQNSCTILIFFKLMSLRRPTKYSHPRFQSKTSKLNVPFIPFSVCCRNICICFRYRDKFEKLFAKCFNARSAGDMCRSGRTKKYGAICRWMRFPVSLVRCHCIGIYNNNYRMNSFVKTSSSGTASGVGGCEWHCASFWDVPRTIGSNALGVACSNANHTNIALLWGV